MSGTLVGMIALGVVVLILFIWMNVVMVRRFSHQGTHTKGRDKDDVAAERTPGTATAVQQSMAHEESSEPLTSVLSADPGREMVELATSPASVQSAADALEVVDERPRRLNGKLFDRPDYPFVLRVGSVSLFQGDAWLQCFRQLTSDSRVLGWMAFAGEALGASDQPYDEGFVDVLRNYWRSLEKLRSEVGLSQVREASIVAAEGNVWVLSAREDTWFALFVESSVDVQEIVDGLLGSVVES